jgi:hypothetical protein
VILFLQDVSWTAGIRIKEESSHCEVRSGLRTEESIGVCLQSWICYFFPSFECQTIKSVNFYVTYELRVSLSKLLRHLSVRQRHFKYCFKQSTYIYMVRVPRSYPSFREHRPELTWITIQVSLGRAEAVYSSSQIVFKNSVSRSSFPFLDPVNPGTR